jgi:type VI secretion system protein ImpE
LTPLFEDAKRRIQANPSDVAARCALWQVFALRGEHDRARMQLDALVTFDSSWAMEVELCHGLLQAEAQRHKVLMGDEPPVCLGDEPSWLADMADALARLKAAPAEAAGRLRQAQMASQACPGTLDGLGFAWLCDGDARLGPCLEVMAKGRYFWLPWSRVRSIVTRAPTELRDRMWSHAMVEIGDEGSIELFLPSRYPNPEDDEQRMSRITLWRGLGEDAYIGLGQKTLITDQGETGFLDVREWRFDAEGVA